MDRPSSSCKPGVAAFSPLRSERWSRCPQHSDHHSPGRRAGRLKATLRRFFFPPFPFSDQLQSSLRPPPPLCLQRSEQSGGCNRPPPLPSPGGAEPSCARAQALRPPAAAPAAARGAARSALEELDLEEEGRVAGDVRLGPLRPVPQLPAPPTHPPARATARTRRHPRVGWGTGCARAGATGGLCAGVCACCRE